MELDPRVIFVTGMSCAGKSTVCDLLIKSIANSFPLKRNDAIWGMMHVDAKFQGESAFSGEKNELPFFEEYVARDSVFPGNARWTETPFGELLQILPRNALYARHVSPASYLVLAKIAGAGLALGKVPVLDRFLAKHIENGAFLKFTKLPFFDGYPKFLIHFVADPEICYERFLGRQHGEDQWNSSRRDTENITKAQFISGFALKEKSPGGIQRISHLMIDTTDKTPKTCAEHCLEFVSCDNNQI